MRSNIFLKNNNTKCLNIDLDFLEDTTNIVRRVSFALQSIQPQGTLVVHALSHALARSLVLGAWHAGWRVAFLPSHLSDKNKYLLLDKLCTSLFVYQNWSNLNLHPISFNGQFLSLDCEESLTKWFEEQQVSLKVKHSSYSWKQQQTALIAFTSGTIGEPKAVCHSLFSILTAAERFIQQFNISSKDRLLNTAMIHTIAGIRCSIVMPLLTGCTVNDQPINGGIFHILEVLEQEKSTIMLTGPSVIRQLSMVADKIDSLPIQLRAIVCGGSPLDRECRTRLFEKFNIKILDGYGFTESGGAIIAESEDSYISTNKSLGRACHDIQLKVIDGEGNERDNGEGELRVYCSSIFLGYLDDRLYSPPYFDTGDMVNIDDSGNVTWLFRIANGVKTASGEWIYTEAVDMWLRKNTLIEDTNISVSEDLGRIQFTAEISGIAPEYWQDWVERNYQELLLDLGQDYNIIKWIRIKSIERSNFGKHQKTIYLSTES